MNLDMMISKIDSLFVNGMLNGIVSILVSLIFIMILKRIVVGFISKSDVKHKRMVIKIVGVCFNGLLAISVLYQFSFMENLMTTLLASGGILAVVIGLASQDAAGNIASGMMILVTKPFVIGDLIILRDEGLRGTVVDINMHHTIIETVDKNPVMIPNTVMNKAIIENITQETDFKYSYLYFDISYESDIDLAISIIRNVIENHELFYSEAVTSDIKVPVHCMEFKDSSISLRAKVTTRTTGDGFQLGSDCRILIKKEFDKNNISIPYPQVQIHQ